MSTENISKFVAGDVSIFMNYSRVGRKTMNKLSSIFLLNSWPISWPNPRNSRLGRKTQNKLSRMYSYWNFGPYHGPILATAVMNFAYLFYVIWGCFYMNLTICDIVILQKNFFSYIYIYLKKDWPLLWLNMVKVYARYTCTYSAHTHRQPRRWRSGLERWVFESKPRQT